MIDTTSPQFVAREHMAYQWARNPRHYWTPEQIAAYHDECDALTGRATRYRRAFAARPADGIPESEREAIRAKAAELNTAASVDTFASYREAHEAAARAAADSGHGASLLAYAETTWRKATP